MFPLKVVEDKVVEDKEELMTYGLTAPRHQEIEEELNRIEAFLLELGKEIHATTAPGHRYTHLWLQVDGSVSYIHSLRSALHQESNGQH